jgi:hypothetical protein
VVLDLPVARTARLTKPRPVLVALMAVVVCAPLVLVHSPGRANPATGAGSDPGLPLPYVAYVWFNCFRRFRCMLQLFNFDVTKVDREMLHMLYMLQVFQMHVASVCSKCFICFHTYVGIVFDLDAAYISHIYIATVYSKMF